MQPFGKKTRKCCKNSFWLTTLSVTNDNKYIVSPFIFLYTFSSLISYICALWLSSYLYLMICLIQLNVF